MPLVIFQLNIRMETKTRTSMPNRMTMEQTIPVDSTETGFWNTIVNSNHGIGSPTVTSKMLEPTEEETAMSPKPFRATMTLVMRSGMDVPAAKKVKPITSGGMENASPVCVAHHTIR